MARGDVDRTVIRAWFEEYGPPPEDYLAVDIEASGVDHCKDYAVQFGWCRVVAGRPVLGASAAVDWSALDPSEFSIFAERLANARAQMLDRGNNFPWTPQLLARVGRAPADALAALRAAFTPGDDPAFASHYGWAFDYPAIGRHFERWTRQPFEPHHDRMWDTALMVKAGQTGLRPRRTEPLRSFLVRLNEARPNGKYNLSECVRMFDLGDSGASVRHAHDAEYDSWLCHLLLERLRAVGS